MTDQRFVERRREGRRHRIRNWLIGILAVVVTGTLIWMIWFSTVFGVRHVEVEGTKTLKSTQVEVTAAVMKGKPLARVDTAQVESRVALLERVESVDVRRHWPNTITIRIRERHAIAWITESGKIRGLDRFGVEFRTFTKPPAGLVEVRVDASDSTKRQGALVEAAMVLGIIGRQDPALGKSIDHVTASTKDSVELVLDKGRVVHWGSAEHSREKLAVLEPLLRIKARSYDVSAPEQPTTRK